MFLLDRDFKGKT